MPSNPDLSPRIFAGHAKSAACFLPPRSVDVVVTSPPYWRKRDYGHRYQLGQEATPQAFVRTLVAVMDAWRPLLAPHASVFINLGDSWRGGKVVGVTTRFETLATKRGWSLVSRVLWAKRHGLPDPHKRLPQRHEFVFQFAATGTPFLDTFAYEREFDLSEGDVWHIENKRSRTPHLAPFPEELPRRAILLACPERICGGCGAPIRRVLRRGLNLDPNRPQSRRAMELWEQHGLNEDHLQAIRATGICDAGKSLRFQDGAGKNGEKTAQLAAHAKALLGGYFREFTFAPREQDGWRPCGCGGGTTECRPGFVLDPFMGSGTTLRAARSLGRGSAGIDLVPMMDGAAPTNSAACGIPVGETRRVGYGARLAHERVW